MSKFTVIIYVNSLAVDILNRPVALSYDLHNRRTIAILEYKIGFNQMQCYAVGCQGDHLYFEIREEYKRPILKLVPSTEI